MKLFYWQSPAGNFGDDLNVWLWDELLPGWRLWDQERVLVGVGTILNTRLLPADSRFLVIGSGAGFGTAPDVADSDKWDVRFVRGPRTAEALRLPPSMAITDPAAMIFTLERFRNIERTAETVFIPHCHSDLDPNYEWPKLCDDAGLTYLSPRGDSDDVIRKIAAAGRVITESMHGAIIADAFRVPWQAVSLVPNFNHFKWRDWGDSMGVDFEITPLPALTTGQEAGRRKPRSRSTRWLGEVLFSWRQGEREATGPAKPSANELATLHGAVVAALRRVAQRTPVLSDGRRLSGRLDSMAERLEAIKRRYARQ